MSISIDRFESSGAFPSYDPFRAVADPIPMFQVQCHSCGYEPPDPLAIPARCPKCNGDSFERIPRPGSLLENASRPAPRLTATM